MNSLHDVGGMDGFGPVEREENEPVFREPWEAHMRAIDALMLKKLHAYCVDETRHRIERINPVYYLGSSYYQIWLLRMESLLIEKGYVTEAEVQAKTREITPEPLTSHLAPYRHIMQSHHPGEEPSSQTRALKTKMIRFRHMRWEMWCA